MEISTKKGEGLKRKTIFGEVLVGLDVLKDTVQVRKKSEFKLHIFVKN